ncbi:MAG: decaprenyl-phosphate phosphoribosyltransferase [Candidatus Binatia bacterium]
MARGRIVVGQEESLVVDSEWTKSLWVGMRPQQWVKNFFVLVPLLLSGKLFVVAATGRAIVAFFLFCLASSAVYLFNDIRDSEKDLLHPQKRRRPLAAGDLSSETALQAGVGLLLLSAIGAMMCGPTLTLILCSYWLLNLLYSLWLKDCMILDVLITAAGFVLRVVGGSVAIQAEMNTWLLACAMLLATLLSFSKRRHEILLLGEHAAAHRQVLAKYTPSFLDRMIKIAAAAAVASYVLYSMSAETLPESLPYGLLMTVPFVLYGVARYLSLVLSHNQGGDPTRLLLTDGPSQANLLLWTLTTGLILS